MAADPVERWSTSFADPSGEAFGDILADTVQLDGSVVYRPVHGRHAVWRSLRIASSLCQEIQYTNIAATSDGAYLEWSATALGMGMEGVMLFVLDVDGQFARVSIYHRPLSAVLAFSAEIAKRLADGPDADHYYQSS